MACTCPEKWSKLPLILKLVPCFALAAFISCLLGFATPVWISAPDNIPVTIYQWLGGKTTLVKMDHMGIWQVCGSSDIGCIALTRDLPGYMIATRVFMTLGFIGSFVVSIMIVLLYCIEKLGNHAKFRLVLLAVAYATAFCIIIAVIVWGAQENLKPFLSFSFAMSCIAVIMYTATATTLLVHFCKS